MFNKLFGNKEKKLTQEEAIAQWEKLGKPLPPVHAVKQKVIKEYAERHGIKTLVETGTYLGDMVEAQRNNFDSIFSIELSEKLYKKATKRFQNADNIHLLQGDSGKRLSEIAERLSSPALFWLDGHYSGGVTALGDKECPVLEELAAILKSGMKHIILIDDARLFNGTHDYPTLSEIEEIVSLHKKEYSIHVMDDIIHLT